jgi:Domain of unknown function (DUF3427)
MRHILIQPAAGAAAKRHFANTVVQPVELLPMSSFLDDKANRSLRKLYPDGSARVWGVTPGKNSSKNGGWEKIQPGDVVLFTGKKRAVAVSTVTSKIHNPRLAEHLWERQPDGRTWEFMYFLSGLVNVDVPYRELNRAAQRNLQFQGFNVLDDARSTRISEIPIVAAAISTLHDPRTHSTDVALPLELHGRYSREEVFSTVGLQYDSRQQHLNTGLSPKCPDGGYFLFITLNKEDFDPAYDYEDRLYEHEFSWVTRRGRSEDHPDYVALREPDTRVSLFVRNRSKEKFAYLGELGYEDHSQAGQAGSAQQSYLWKINHPVPPQLLAELNASIRVSSSKPSAKKRPSSRKANRRPGSFDEYSKAFSYVLGEPNRTVNPAHQHYQVDLKSYLHAKHIKPELEKDFVDVGFWVNGMHFIGEIKVTNCLTPAEAFRIAIGQVLEYSWIKVPDRPRMIVFLDQEISQPRVSLASRLEIALVVKSGDDFLLLNPEVSPELRAVFSPIAKAAGA